MDKEDNVLTWLFKATPNFILFVIRLTFSSFLWDENDFRAIQKVLYSLMWLCMYMALKGTSAPK